MKALAILCASIAITTPFASAQEEALDARVTAIKESLAKSKKVLREYEWIQTTVVLYKGEEKSHMEERCYWGDDGTLQKVPVGEMPEPERQRRGLRGRIEERKKEELTKEVKATVALMHQYVPPDPALLQASREAGNLTFQPAEGGGGARLAFADYLKPGDSLGLGIDLETNRLQDITVKTYLEEPDKPVGLNVSFGKLEDGTSYVSKIDLQDPSADIEVQVANTGYQKLEQDQD